MNSESTILAGNLVDLHQASIYPAEIHIQYGTIQKIEKRAVDSKTFLMPGFVDAHVHVESSMLTPAQFARVAVTYGTVATVSDPHEIANVLGVSGIDFMLEDAASVPLKIAFGAPSCVPATPFETAGAVLDAKAVTKLLRRSEVPYLSEMMNYPGVLNKDPEVLQKISAAQHRNKPVDGHAPGLRGERAASYIAAGISTDHECTSKDEALDKLAAGAHILIRQGSAARNFDALYPLISEYPQKCMFCSDDKHPDELLQGHIDQLVREAVRRGLDVFDVLRAACLNPVRHYGLNVGTLRVGEPADLIEVDTLSEFRVMRTWINGQLVSAQRQAQFTPPRPEPVNCFNREVCSVDDFSLKPTSKRVRVIEAIDGELITKGSVDDVCVEEGNAVADVTKDILKMTVVNRYQMAQPAVAFVRGFGLRRGAIASSVAHDCHNIVAVGCTDADLCRAVNLVIEQKGGVSAVGGDEEHVLPLPVAGLMALDSCEQVGAAYAKLDTLAKQLGSALRAPYMTLSFMALLVIPQLKLSDKGLFDGEAFEFVSVFV